MSHLCTLLKGPVAVVAPSHVLCNPLLQPYLLFMKDGRKPAICFNVKAVGVCINGAPFFSVFFFKSNDQKWVKAEGPAVAAESGLKWFTARHSRNCQLGNRFKVTNYVFSLHVSFYQLAFPMLIQHISGKRPTFIHTPATHAYICVAVHYVHFLSLTFIFIIARLHLNSNIKETHFKGIKITSSHIIEIVYPLFDLFFLWTFFYGDCNISFNLWLFSFSFFFVSSSHASPDPSLHPVSDLA